MYIVIASPDRTSIGMFVDFYKSKIDRECPLGSIQYLISSDSLNIFMKSFKEKYPEKGIISYYVKRKNEMDPSKVIPNSLIEWADVVLWLDIYSVEIVVVKDKEHFYNINGNLWKNYIKIVGGI
jgi:hypothetical protein